MAQALNIWQNKIRRTKYKYLNLNNRENKNQNIFYEKNEKKILIMGKHTKINSGKGYFIIHLIQENENDKHLVASERNEKVSISIDRKIVGREIVYILFNI